MDKKEAAEELMHCMNQFRLLNKKYHVHMELPAAEFFTMVAIYKITEQNKQKENLINGATTTQVVKLLGTTLSAASKLMRNLEEKKLIERIACPSDRRVTYIRLSNSGSSLLQSERNRRDQIMTKVIEHLGDDRVEQMLTTLHDMYHYLSQELEEYHD